MKYLLDTHAILWYAQGNRELSETALSVIETKECFYSIASLWEIAIKQKLGKLDSSLTSLELDDFCHRFGLIPLSITPFHVEKTKSLDFIHRDPFDRLLIAQALTENLTIITCDGIIPQYDVRTIW